jgi:two-component system cell cycle sensor histidine kinase/response regulator CckA
MQEDQSGIGNTVPPDLRRRAEELLAAWPAVAIPAEPGDVEHFVRQLRVRQVELELECENLRRNQGIQDIELAVDGILKGCPEGKITYANGRARALVGRQLNELLGLHISDLFDPGELAANPLRFDLVKQGQLLTNERNVLRPDGSRLPVEMRSRMMPDGTFQSFLRDITERRRIERALRESEATLRATLESAADGILAVDSKGKVVQVNRRFAELWRLPWLLVEQRDDAALLNAVLSQLADPTAFLEKVDALYDSDDASMDLLPFKDGRCFQRYSIPMVLNGSRIGRVWSFRDITELRRTADELRESRDYLRAVLDSTTDGICVEDPETGQIMDANRRMSELYGYAREELLCTPIGTLSEGSSPYSQAEALAWHEKTRRLGPQTFEWRARRKNGDLFWVEVSLRFTALENAERIIVTVHDITERKRAAEEIVKRVAERQRLQKAESLGRMAGAVAHLFNNKLMAVMGNLELAMDDLPRSSASFAAMSAALHAAHRAAEVSRSMQTYLGQTNGRHALLDLSRICHQTLPVLSADKPANVEFKRDLPETGPIVSADASQVQQILSNLLSNACEAVGAARGTVRLAIKTVAAADIPVEHRFPIGWEPQPQAYACLEVSDTGCGIERKDIDTIFDPFFSTKFTGRGLGLAVVLGIVRSHGGAITVEGRPGRGSTFRVFFPVPEKAVAPESEAVPKPEKTKERKLSVRGQACTVLLIDDELSVRKVVAAALQLRGFTVFVAEDGTGALEIFRQHQAKIDCVLCDLTMPGMDGWATLAALRKLESGIPVILASGYDEVQVMTGDHPEWPQAFLGKPYQLKALRDTIEKVVGQDPPGKKEQTASGK